MFVLTCRSLPKNALMIYRNGFRIQDIAPDFRA